MFNHKFFSFLTVAAILVAALPMVNVASAQEPVDDVECMPSFGIEALKTLGPGEAIMLLDNSYDRQGGHAFGVTWLGNTGTVPMASISWSNWHGGVPNGMAAVTNDGTWGVFANSVVVNIASTGSQGGRYYPVCAEDPGEVPAWLQTAAREVLTVNRNSFMFGDGV